MSLKQHIAAGADMLPQNDLWLHDVGMGTQTNDSEDIVAMPLSRSRTWSTMKQTASTGGAEEYSREAIGPEHSLWLTMLHLSEIIWREMFVSADHPIPVGVTAAEVVRKRALDLLRAEATALHTRDFTDIGMLLRGIINEVLGYGPLRPLLQDRTISEIVVVGVRGTYVERDGHVEEVGCRFANEQHMLRIIRNLLRHAGRSMFPQWPLADAYLPDGSLVSVTLPPNTINGPTITIRKRARKQLVIPELVEYGTLSKPMADFLCSCIQARCNIIISGGCGSGKTTLLNALCAHLPLRERIVTIEEEPELRLSQKQVVGLLSSVANSQDTPQVTTRDLLLHAQRMRPGRIVIGECRGDEAEELLRTMGSGYGGVMTTMYALDVKDCLARLELFCLSDGMNVPAITYLRTQIARSLNVIVHISRLRDGSHKIIHVAEVVGIEEENIKLQDIFYFKEDGFDEEAGVVLGTFEACEDGKEQK